MHFCLVFKYFWSKTFIFDESSFKEFNLISAWIRLSGNFTSSDCTTEEAENAHLLIVQNLSLIHNPSHELGISNPEDRTNVCGGKLGSSSSKTIQEWKHGLPNRWVLDVKDDAILGSNNLQPSKVFTSLGYPIGFNLLSSALETNPASNRPTVLFGRSSNLILRKYSKLISISKSGGEEPSAE